MARTKSGTLTYGKLDEAHHDFQGHSWYWPLKLARNAERDRDTNRRLAEVGWLAVRVWEHEGAEEDEAVRMSRRGTVRRCRSLHAALWAWEIARSSM